MNQTRAFSDTEIVTIALVAASALGGIVIGLGRGGENGRRDAGLRASVNRAVEAGAAHVPTLPEARVPDSFERLRKSYEEIERPDPRELAQRAGARLEARPKLEAVRRRVPTRGLKRGSGMADSLRTLGANVLEAGIANASGIDFEQLRSDLLSNLSRPASNGSADRHDGPGVIDRIADELGAIEDSVSDAPEALRSATARTGSAIQRRVASPVAHAAATTGEATKESLAALAWLGVGAAVVYFGLLSDARREQVKAGLCGALEQARLLLLDFQGYEPEM